MGCTADPALGNKFSGHRFGDIGKPPYRASTRSGMPLLYSRSRCARVWIVRCWELRKLTATILTTMAYFAC